MKKSNKSATNQNIYGFTLINAIEIYFNEVLIETYIHANLNTFSKGLQLVWKMNLSWKIKHIQTIKTKDLKTEQRAVG